MFATTASLHSTAPPTDAAAPSFLARLCRATGMAGAAIIGEDVRWIDMSGATPPTGLAPHLFGPTGRIGRGDDPAAQFVLVVPIPAVELDQRHWLVVWDKVARSDTAANLLLAQVTELVAHAAMARRRNLEMQRLQLLERASKTAHIGMWSCTPPDENLVWTDGVYDLFELPHGSPLCREQIVRMYTPESAEQLTALRSHAIATLGDFNLDAEIITTSGKHRWMRITAAVDGVNGQARLLLGMKQDITEEKLMSEKMRRMAETDALTGLANRALFQARLSDLHGRTGGRPVGALLLVDLDHFKTVNDELGHDHGDHCLIEAGRRLRQVCPASTQVARIGGDEFAILTDARQRLDLDQLCETIVAAFDTPFRFGNETRRIGVSVGMALLGQHDADTLYRNADIALYQAKADGRGTWRQFRAA